MIGSIRHEVKIDYTGVSTPLTVEDVYRDLQHAEAVHGGGEVERFVMWEHQWDFMLKRADVDDENFSYVYEDDGRWLWGVRVELADAPKPIAVLQVNSQLTDEEAEEIRERFAAAQPPAFQPFRAQILAEQQSIIDRVKARGRKPKC